MHKLHKSALLAFAAAAVFVGTAHADPTPRQALKKIVPNLQFDGIGLGDALDFLRDVSGTNFIVNWRALEAAGIDKTTPVTVRLRSVPLRTVLNMVLQEAGAGNLAWFIEDGVLTVTTKEIADSQLITRVYPVQDLLVDIPDFTDAPQIQLGQSGGGGGGRGGGGGGGRGGGGGSSGGGGGGGGGGIFGGGGAGGGAAGGGANGNNGKPASERGQDLVDLITSIIEPDVWVVNGGRASIRFFQGNLVVTAPRSVHEALGGNVD